MPEPMPQPESWRLLAHAVSNSPSVWLIIGVSLGAVLARALSPVPVVQIVAAAWLFLLIAFAMEWHRVR